MLLASQRADAAIQVYRKALQHNSDDELSWFGLGQSLVLLDQIEEAIATLEQAVQLKPQHWQAYYSLGEALSKAQRWPEAVDAYQKAIAIESDFSWSYNNLGFALLNLHRWQLAVTAYTRAIELNQSFSWSYYNLAEALLHLDQVEEAIVAYGQAKQYQPTIEGIDQKIQRANSLKIKLELQQSYQAYLRAIEQNPQDLECYARALQIQPQQVELYQQWAQVLIEQQQHAKAIEVYQTALHRNPQWAEGYYQLAQLAEPSSVAMAALQKALELQPQLGTIEQYERLGEYLSEQQQFEPAQGLYQQALKIYPNLQLWYRRLGRVFAQQQNWPAAIEAYQQAVELEATAEVYQDLGNVYLQLQQPESASAYYRQALQLQPESASGHFYLAIALVELHQFEAALEHYQQGEWQTSWGGAIVTQAQQKLAEYLEQQQQFEAAVKIYRQIIQREPNHPAQMQLGQILQQQGKLAEAIEFYREVLQHQPENYQCTCQLGATLAQSGDWAAAVEVYQQALSLESEPLEALGELVRLHQQQGQNQAAAEYQQRILALCPDAGEYIKLAQTYYQLQQPQRSIQCYRRAIELKPLPDTYERLGEILRQHQPQAAVELYQQAIAAFPDKIQFIYGLAQTYSQLQQWSEATVAYTQIVQQQPDWQAYHELGDSLIHQQQWQAAIEAYQQAIKLNSESIWSYHNLSTAYAQLQQWEEVLQAQTEISRINPQFWQDNWTEPTIHQGLGDYLYEQRRYDEAQVAYSRAVQNNPDYFQSHRAVQNNPDYFQSHHQLGDTFLLQEQPEEAIACYARAIELRPDYFWAHHNLGEAAIRLERWSEAVAAYTEASKIQPDNADVKQKLSRAYYEQIKASSTAAIGFYEHQLQQQQTQANPFYERVYRQLKSLLNLHIAADGAEASPQYYLQRAQTNLKQQQWAKAIADYKQALHLTAQIDRTWRSEVVGGIRPEPITVEVDTERVFTRNITIIIPIYNAYEDTKRCIYSVLQSTKVQYDLLLIDDCSTDTRVSEFVEQIAKEHSHITCIQNPQNQGFVRTCNLAFAITQGEDVVILNSDTVVTPGWLEKLERAAYSHPQIASVTPLTNNGEICSVPHWLEYNDLPKDFTIESFGNLVETVAIGRYPTIPTCVGFCTYMKREVFDHIGFFDEVSFGKGYGEENDWSIRARVAGYYHIIDDSTFIYHAGGKSFGVEEKEQLVLNNFKPLQQLHPQYFEEIHQFIALKPYQEILTNLQLHLKLKAITRQTPVCFLLHNATDFPVNGPLGGTEYHCAALIEQMRQTQPVYTLCYNRQTNSLRLSIFLAEEVLRFEFPCQLSDSRNEPAPEFRQLLVDLLAYFRPSLIHIHHLINLPIEDVHQAIKQLEIPYVVTFHDYYLICPSFSLLDYQNQFCYEHKDEQYCRQCVQQLFGQGENLKAEWDQQAVKLLADASGLIAPSDTARFYYASEYPQYAAKMETIRHGILPKATIEAYLPYKQAATNRAVSLPLKVAFVGGINEPKGLNIIIELLELVHSQPQLNSQLQFALYGATSKPLPETITNITIHNRYQRQELPQLLESVDLAIFPGIWAETYCLVADEVLALGIPIIATPLGAVPERIKQYGIGWISESSAAASLVKLLDFLIHNPAEITKVKQQVAEYPVVSYEAMAQQYVERYSYWQNRENKMMPSKLAPQTLLPGYLQASLNIHA